MSSKPKGKRPGSIKKPFLSHLEDLRDVLLKSLIALFCTAALSFIFIPKLFAIIILPYERLVAAIVTHTTLHTMKSLTPSETLLISIKLALLAGLILASPFILYQIWQFVRPGLVQKERRYLKVTLSLSPVFFLAGSLFAYSIVFPLVLRFLWRYTTRMGIEPMWTVSYYTNFIISFLFAFGIAFQMPIVITLLAKIGLITHHNLISKRRHAIVIIFIIAAILTPPDVISQLLLGLPLIALYELSILAARLVREIK